MTLSRIAILSCAALITFMLAAAMLIRAGEGPFHVIETAVTPTVEVAGLASPSISAGRPENADLGRLAMTVFVLLLLSSLTALVTLLGVIGSENLALKGRRVIEVTLGAPPRWLLAAAMRLWRRRLLVAGIASGLLCAGTVSWLVWTIPPGTSLRYPAVWPAALVLVVIALVVYAAAVAPIHRLYRPGLSLSREADQQQYTDPRPQQFNRVLLVTCQLTIAVAILAGSGLMVLAGDRPPGMVDGALDAQAAPGRTVVGQLASRDTAAGDGDPAAHAALYASALSALGDAPGVAAESLATPGAWMGRGPSVIAVNYCGPCSAGGFPNPIHRTRVRVHAVMPGFFAKRGMEIQAGQGLDAFSADTRPPGIPERKYGRSVVINESYAREHFSSPVGRSVMLRGDGGEVWYDVVGVVRDTPRGGLGDSGPRYAVYYSAVEHPPSEIELVATVNVPAAAGLDDSLRVVQGALAEVPESELSITGFRWARDEIARVWGTAGWVGGGTRLAGVLAAIVALAGVMSALRAHIRARLREMGIRAALGAPPRSLRRMVLRETLRISLVGTGLGLWVATTVIAFLSPSAVDTFNALLFVTITVLFVGGAVAVALPSAWLAATAHPSTVMQAQNRVG